MPAPPQFLFYVDASAEAFIARLKRAVAIPSISVHHTWLNKELRNVGVTTKLVDMGSHVMEGETLPLPPVILGRIGNDSLKKTVLFYGHFDVQPAALSDGWRSEPFVLTQEADGRMVGRGSSDDKGPVLGWINVLQWHYEHGKELPVNMCFCFEGMEESGSEGLDELFEKEKHGWFKDVDCSDSYWLNTRPPAITYRLRGIVYFSLTVSDPARDLHSGEFGRAVHEPMTDLIAAMSRLVAPDGSILVSCVDDLVPPPHEDERAIYEKLDYSLADLEATVGASIALSDDKATVLMGRMRFPSLSVHGIEGAFSGPGSKTVIPAKVMGKFSIRSALVPPQTPDNVIPLVSAYVEREFAKLNTKSNMLFSEYKSTQKLDVIGTGEPWLDDMTHWNYTAAIRATEAVYDKAPELTREGGAIPVTLTFANALGANVVLLPMGRGDDGAHSTNEKLDRSNFIQGTKLLGSYVYEIAAVKEVGSSKGEVMARG
ncbi:hypothetical protein C8R43DRAFT_1093229 [Mycena crocata]|nr:hypothetical protein C8R43DRAFT_1093229 [Mycena crocata]